MEGLKKKRAEKGLTQEYIAFKLGVARNTVCQWETGKRECNFDTLKRLSKILECTIDELL